MKTNNRIIPITWILVLCIQFAHGHTILPDDTLSNCIIIPNTFSPGKLGTEQCFQLKYADSSAVKSFSLSVFNRWGSLVFESNNICQKWCGESDNKVMPAGTYIYLLRASIFDKTNAEEIMEVEKTGTITLLR
jgi:gliding motility-associated-like protein